MAGAIRTGPVTVAYEEGWERAFGVPQPPDIEAVPVTEEEAVNHLRRFENEGGAIPDIRPAVEREVAALSTVPYSCPVCGWHLTYSSDKCGNATCPRGRTRYVTRG